MTWEMEVIATAAVVAFVLGLLSGLLLSSLWPGGKRHRPKRPQGKPSQGGSGARPLKLIVLDVKPLFLWPKVPRTQELIDDIGTSEGPSYAEQEFKRCFDVNLEDGSDAKK